MSRDSAFYRIAKDVVNVSRKKIDTFLKRQNIIRQSDRQQATSKRGSRKVTKKGQLHFDLIEVKWTDFPFTPTDIPKYKPDKVEDGEDEDVHKGYIFSMSDALTSLSFFKFHTHKTQKQVTPIAHEAFKYFAKMLQKPITSFVGFSDRGKEFNFKQYETWGVRTRQLKRSSVIEARNAFFQSVLYRLAKMKNTTSIQKLVKDAMDITNNTQSSLTKKTPLENTEDKVVDVSKKYNKRRGKDSGIKIRRKALQVGDKVRYQLLGDKDKGIGYKSYKSILWSKRAYKVQQTRGNRYKVFGKFFHRDQLRLTPDADQKSEMLLQKRELSNQRVSDSETAKTRKKIDANVQGHRRSSRAGTKRAKEKFRAQQDKWKKFDRSLN